jgi:hypothetical protein
MATFINPIEILDLQDADLASIDSTTIKKAKRKLFADIDLSDDGTHGYKGLALSKNECEAAIDRMEDGELMPYYHYLARHPKLNDYLANGDEAWFEGIVMDDMIADTRYIRFVSPLLAPRLDRTMLKAFTDQNIGLLGAAAKAMPLLHAGDTDAAYRSLSRELQLRIEATEAMTQAFKDEKSSYTEANITDVRALVEEQYPIVPLNALPLYFQSQRGKIAEALNYLQLQIWENFEAPSLPMQILEHLLQLTMDSASKPTFEGNLALARKRHQTWATAQEHAPVLGKWTEAIKNLRTKTKSVEAKVDLPSKVLEDHLAGVKIKDLNDLPAFADDTRAQFASALRSIAIASWNAQDDIRSAITFIDLALQVHVAPDLKQGFVKDKADLVAIEKKHRGVVICYFCDKNQPKKGCEFHTTIYQETSRSYFPQRKVQYQYIAMELPRCESCKETHEGGKEWGIFIPIATTLVGIFIGATMRHEPFIIGGIIGLVPGLIASYLLKEKRLKDADIKGTGNSVIRTHPLLTERIAEGWSLTKPTA